MIPDGDTRKWGEGEGKYGKEWRKGEEVFKDR